MTQYQLSLADSGDNSIEEVNLDLENAGKAAEVALQSLAEAAFDEFPKHPGQRELKVAVRDESLGLVFSARVKIDLQID